MSASAQTAVLPVRTRDRPAPISDQEIRAERPLVRIAAFAALGLYGVSRWSTLLTPAPTWRLLGLVGLAVLVAAVGAPLATRSRALAIGGAVVAAFALLPIAGVPVSWVLNIRIDVSSDAIGRGLSALPGVLLPYVGGNHWIRVVIILGAGVLLLDAAAMLAFAPRAFGDLRRAGAAVPLIALAIVPSTLQRPHLPYFQGLLLFALLGAFMWGERVRQADRAWVLAICAAAGATGLIAAPAIDPHRPWLNYQALATKLAPAHLESFNWAQGYGPLHWPRTGREVLDVRAGRAEYWKAEDLDMFDGRRWTQGLVAEARNTPQPSSDSLQRWSQTLQVTMRDMKTTDVIASGFASAPKQLSQTVVPGFGQGTWNAGTTLVPGDSYLINTYAPEPSGGELAQAGADYGRVPAGYRTIMLSPTAGSAGPAEIVFPPFHSSLPVQSQVRSDAGSLIKSSPYGGAFILARRLSARATTPYAFIVAVESYLAHGFTYSEKPPVRAYPLESFLFKDRIGYCQQFAGAMALLLRMGGIPARVAAGFTSGTYDSATQEYVVSDTNAHAWVEAWFPTYGWVRFDPTPKAAPARGGNGIVPAPSFASGSPLLAAAPKVREPVRTAARRSSTRHAAADATPFIAAVLAALLALLAAMSRRAVRRPADNSPDALLAELERALSRCGRPLAAGVTLASLEQRFNSSPAASGYVRAIRLARFGGASAPPTSAQRRALRAHLHAGLGVWGRLRALWALPPRRAARRGGAARRFPGRRPLH